ncbi:MAG: DUF1820 family protein [Acidobacteriota bacterium]|jgi:hypothetical protein
MPPREKRVYKVIFHNQNQVFEVYARKVAPADMLGFVQVEDLLFGERSQVLVDSSEERLKVEFAGVKRFFLPLGAVIRIDEVDKAGTGRVTGEGKAGSVITPFPTTILTPPKQS